MSVFFRPGFVAFLLMPAAMVAQTESPVAKAFVSELREAALDPDSCVRVRELELVRQDLRFYFTDGYLIFAQPLHGRRLFAVFAAPDSGGDAEVLLRPPNASERASLASFTESPNLDEHFLSAVFIFSDATYDELQTRLGDAKRSPEMGTILAYDFNGAMRNLGQSFSVRLLQELLTEREDRSGFFFGAIGGVHLGNFDVMVDPMTTESVMLGQLTDKNGAPSFNIWANFEGRGSRPGKPAEQEDVVVRDYKIDATLLEDVNLEAVTRVTFSAAHRIAHCLPFQIAHSVEVSSAALDGKPVEIFRREALRESLIRGSGNDNVLVLLPQALEPGREHILEFHHRGQVGRLAGDRVFYVEARTNWYPNFGLQFARFDLTFRVPKDLDVVATGELVDEKTEGEWHTVHRRTSHPVRLAGFNLGAYRRARIQRGPYTVDVFANSKAEDALARRTQQIIVQTPTGRGGRMVDTITNAPLPPPDPARRLALLATEIATSFEWLAGVLGPPPLPALTVTPIPATFGQGFPGLIYLSTVSFLREEDRPAYARSTQNTLFYSEILYAHETAHQWWGNITVAATYHDEWLNEALANYSALMVLERRKGARVLEEVLDEYARNLRRPGEDGKPLDAAGPIAWGMRLNSNPSAYRAITYDKGSWILHMLRRRMGDPQFLKFLAALRRRFERELLTIDGFRETAVEFLPKNDPDPRLEAFFDQWIYSTGIPTFSLSSSTQGAAPNVRLTLRLKQSDVDEDFSVDVPVEIRLAGQRPLVRWIRSASEPVSVTVALKQAPQKVELAPGGGVLAVRK